MTKLKPIIEDYGDGYIAFCPICETCLGWESSCTNRCETCGAELDLPDGGGDREADELETGPKRVKPGRKEKDEKRICKTVAGEEAASGVFY